MLDILVVDDDDIVRESLCSALVDAGHRVLDAPDGEKALSLLGAQPFDLAICDVHLPGIDGRALFRRIQRDAPGTDVVLMTAFGSVPDAVSAVREGAEYLTKPFEPDDLVRRVVGPIAQRRARRRGIDEIQAATDQRRARSAIVGTSLVMQRLGERLVAAARTDESVLVVGERGTGKALIARTIHAQSPRRGGPLVVVAAGTADSLHQAEGGTLVLDGLEDLSAAAQATLLRALDERPPPARSGRPSAPAGARVVTLCRADLRARVAAGRFLRPLFFSLGALELEVPPLRARAGDLYLLVNHLLRERAASRGATPELTPGAWRALHDYPFPGNVRELAWVIEQALSASGGRTIDVGHLPAALTRAVAKG